MKHGRFVLTLSARWTFYNAAQGWLLIRHLLPDR